MDSESQPFVETVATLQERCELDEEVREHLLKRVGEPTGPQGLPLLTAARAAQLYSWSWVLPVVGPLIWTSGNLLGRWVLQPLLMPLVVRHLSPKAGPADLGKAREIAQHVRSLTEQSSFARFHWRQSMAWGGLLIAVSLLSCGIGAIPAGIFYTIKCYEAHHHTLRGKWFIMPIVGKRLLTAFTDEPA